MSQMLYFFYKVSQIYKKFDRSLIGIDSMNYLVAEGAVPISVNYPRKLL